MQPDDGADLLVSRASDTHDDAESAPVKAELPLSEAASEVSAERTVAAGNLESRGDADAAGEVALTGLDEKAQEIPAS